MSVIPGTQHDLLERAIGGNEESLTTLLKEHGPGVRRSLEGSIPRRWRSVLSMDDVMQQAYAEAFLSIGRFMPRDDCESGGFAAWLACISRRTLIDALRMMEAEKRGGGRRRIGQTRCAGDGSTLALLAEEIGFTTTTPSRAAARTEASDALTEAVAGLPMLQRRVVEMYDLAGKTAEEVGAAIGRTTGAVYMLRARALRRLCERLGTMSRYLTR